MSRKARENIEGRMYKQHLKSTGRLPDLKEKRAMEKKANKIAERAENKKIDETAISC